MECKCYTEKGTRCKRTATIDGLCSQHHKSGCKTIKTIKIDTEKKIETKKEKDEESEKENIKTVTKQKEPLSKSKEKEPFQKEEDYDLIPINVGGKQIFVKRKKPIARGRIGCALSPPLSSHDSSLIGKEVSSEENATREYDVGKMFRDIDPTGKYGIYAVQAPVKIFPTDSLFTHRKQDIVQNCGFSASKPIFETLFKKGVSNPLGGGVHRSPEIPCSSIESHLKAFENLFQALVVFHNNKLYHGDVHAGNIVRFGSVAEPESYKFIDFDLSGKDSSGKKFSDDNVRLTKLANLLGKAFSCDSSPVKKLKSDLQNLEKGRFENSQALLHSYQSIVNEYRKNIM